VAITIEGNAAGGTAETTQSQVVIPATTQAGDRLFFWVVQGRTGDPPASVTDDDTGGNAWTEVTGIGNLVVSGYLYTKVATSGSAGKTVTAAAATGDPPDSIHSSVTVYRGSVATPSIENAAATALASGTESVAGVTTSAANAMVCLFNGLANNVAVSSQAATDPAALTERYDSGSSAGTDIEISHASAVKATAGATGNITWSHTDVAAVAVVLDLIESGGGSSQTVSPTGLGSASVFGSPTAAPGGVNVGVSGLASASSFGTPSIVPGGATVAVSGLGSASSFGSVDADDQAVQVSGLASSSAFGAPTIAVGNVGVPVSGLTSASQFGSSVTTDGGEPTFSPAIHGGKHR